jgi:chemotaxis signal transduction protein
MAVFTPSLEQPFVIARVDTTILGIPSAWVVEMLLCGDVSPLPLAPDYVRGITIRRDRAVRVVDARVRLGATRRAKETDDTVALLEAREADHVRWLDALVESIRTTQPFTLARDPHGCAFGKWYDQYVPPTMTLKYQLAKFDAPHRRIHALASEAEALAASAGTDSALRLLEDHRSTTLAHMRGLFQDTRALVQHDVREIIVVHESGHQLLGLVVDDIESVERLRPETLVSLEGRVPSGHDPLVRWTARTAREQVVLLPDMRELMGELLGSRHRSMAAA